MHAGTEEVAKPRFERRPGVQYELREDGIQSRRLSWLQASDGSSKFFRLKGLEILWPSGVGIFHRSDNSLLTSLVDSRSPVLCAPFFTSCVAMEFAETGFWWKERPDLSVSLLMVLHALRLECEKSMGLTASHRSCFFCPSRDSRDAAALSGPVSTGARVKER